MENTQTSSQSTQNLPAETPATAPIESTQQPQASQQAEPPQRKKFPLLIIVGLILIFIVGGLSYFLGMQKGTQQTKSSAVTDVARIASPVPFGESSSAPVAEATQKTLTCQDTPELQLSPTEQDSFQQKIEVMFKNNQVGNVIALSAPDVVVDCTDTQKLENDNFAASACEGHSTDTNMKLYALGIVPEGVEAPIAEISSLLEKHAKQYGPFTYQTTYSNINDCGVSFIFENQENTAAIRVSVYKRLMENSAPVVIVTPTIYTPDSIGELETGD